MKCAMCPESRFYALALDHIDGGGKRHRAAVGHKSGFEKWLKKSGMPSGYRVLCHNCNWRVFLSGMKLKQTANAIRAREYRRLLKTRIMGLLGSVCIECNCDDLVVLTVHHENHDGAGHRLIISGGKCGHDFYRAILRSGDLTGLVCCCLSCNDVLEINRRQSQ